MTTGKSTVYALKPSASGELALNLSLPFARVEKVQIVGTDLVLLLAGGERHILQGAALQAAINPNLRITFADRAATGAELINAAGAVELTDVATRSLEANVPPLPADAKAKRSAIELLDDDGSRRATDQPLSDNVPRPTVAPTPGGIAAPDLGAAFNKEAATADRPASPSLIVVVAPASGTYTGAPGVPPPPPPPVDSINVEAIVRNIAGATRADLEGGGVRIQGAAGSAASAADLSPAAQAAPELLVGTAGNDIIDGDGAAGMGSGFARLLTIQASARTDLTLTALTISGLPPAFVVVGAVKAGSGWQVTLPPDLAELGNNLDLIIQYPVAADGTPFAESKFDIRISATGTLEGKEITGDSVVPAILRDVRSSADLDYSVNGKSGVVFAAFGLGDDIRAGAGNDTIRGLVGHDLISAGDGNDSVDGGSGDDTIEGGAGADSLDGGTGSDTIVYTRSDEGVIIDLEAGTASGGEAKGDTITNIENVVGSASSDSLSGTSGANKLQGGEGNDWLTGRGGADRLDGGAGIDTSDYSASGAGVSVNLTDGTGAGGDAEGDVLTSIENLVGSAQADTLVGNDGANRLDGLGGDDLLEGGGGADELLGGDGNDTASYAGSLAAVVVNLADRTQNTGDAAGDVFTSIENLEGSELADALTGDASNNILWGNPGDDVLSGGGGADLMVGGAGRDSMDGGDGIDTASYEGSNEGVTASLLSSEVGRGGDAEGDSLANIENLTGSRFSDRLTGNSANNTLTGGRGNDVLTGGGGADQLLGGEGSDTVDYAGSAAVTINLTTSTATGGDANGDTFDSIENVVGSSAADRLTGDGAANSLEGAAGDDTLEGLLGNDTLNGGSGDDLLDGGGGADTLRGGLGTDTVTYSAAAGAVTVNLATGLGSGSDADGDVLSGVENLIGSGFADTLVGDAANNVLSGGTGDDMLEGGQGSDRLDGGDGLDTASYAGSQGAVIASLSASTQNSGDALGDIYVSIENLAGSGFDDTLVGSAADNQLSGGAGNDVLAGLAGRDTLRGGAGSDTADYTASEAAVTINLRQGVAAGGDAEGDTLIDIENLKGTRYADALIGSGGDNLLYGQGGNDMLEGGQGADGLYGGDGVDTASYANAQEGVIARIANADANEGEAAGDSYDSIENLIGSSFNDELAGDGADNTLDGGEGNDTLVGGAGADQLRGGGGSDTASYASSTSGVTASLAAAADNTGDAAGDRYESIENLIGSSQADLLVGNSVANVLTGGAGDDVLSGGAGADTLTGGTGGDTATYASSASAVAVNLTTGRGSGGDAQGDILSEIENLRGSSQADILTGNSGANRLEGGDGDDILDGRAGADALVGGDGDDTYVVDDASDVVTEKASEGSDLVRASVSYTLTTHVENLELAAGAGAIDGTGNSAANSITGNESANLLDGGSGADKLAGGEGDDTYVVDNVADQILELADSGTDSVRSSVTWTLGAHVENLTLTGDAGSDGTGNDLANTLLGNSAANRLDGGAGADRLEGGAGDDVYVLDNAGDQVVEAAAQGTDLVFSSVSHSLAANVENLTLTGNANISGSGNSLGNVIVGNAGSNWLDGGAGADTLSGGAGDDTYVVDSLQDVVQEEANAGTDTVRSYVSYGLAATLENLVLLGTGDIKATGNASANQITGNAGDNEIDGGGGADVMAGGAGNDSYRVDSVEDTVTEDEDAGVDSVTATVSYSLSANVEKLFLSGSANLNGTGNELANTIVGNSGNNTLDGGQGGDSLDGGLGDDTYIVDSTGDVVLEETGAGTDTVRSSVSYTLGNSLENLVLLGTASIDGTGNGADNRLTGNAGNNILDGRGGADTMEGGRGNDTYIVDAQGDAIVESAGEGTDTVLSSVSYALSANLENLELRDGAGNIDATGNELANTLLGNDGNNRLDGGGGGDTMAGGRGDDVYVVDSAQDSVSEASNAGTDLVESSVSFTLSANVENLVLKGASTINATGNSGANKLEGNGANNVLDGRAGADAMLGGDGDDIYVVDDALDVVTEKANEGSDLVRSSVSYTLTANVENLELTSGAGDLEGRGNGGANLITGNEGNNLLDGGGGADVLVGGDGSDTYVVDNPLDVVFEEENQGSDQVQASVSYTLSKNVEKLTLTGSADIDGTGNGLANQLLGNSGANILDGGTGADTLTGGDGNDVYIVDSTGDTVIEANGGGNDTVRAKVTYTLTDNVESLELTGTSSINGTGNSLGNQITGNAGDNFIDGGGGADGMTGGSGNDTYVVDDQGDVVTEAANGGTDTVRSSLDYTLVPDVENLVLTGTAIAGTGNALNNLITVTGVARANVLDGGAGADTMEGGGGNDTYYVDNAGDQVIEQAQQGTDTVYASVSYTLGSAVENLILTGTAAINGTGSDVSNEIYGNGGNNQIDGKGGADVMVGGAGDDTYYVDLAEDVVVEGDAADQGYDTVVASVSYNLGAGLEAIKLFGSASIDATGNSANNALEGNDGNNRLDGAGGADSMTGGGGDDTYLVDDAGDVVVENLNKGYDLVRAQVSYTLSANVERLELEGSGNLNGTGNQLANVIVGNVGNNRLDGGGGSGDVLQGGAGDDTYVVTATATTLIETQDDGTDTVQSSISWTLADHLEILELTGSAAINGTGNAANNVLRGNDAANTLNGGQGNDFMEGLGGDDTYVVDSVGDSLQELDGGGSDTVQSAVTWTLGSHVENLTLTGTGLIDGTGNELANRLIGNAAANQLDGGAGADYMEGQGGSDTYLVDNAGDQVVEAFMGGAADRVRSTVSYQLTGEVEILELLGSGNLNGTGNNLANLIYGNAGANQLDGGAGADILEGGAGNDTYVVDNALDEVVETSLTDKDTVRASVSYTLSANVEDLVLTGTGNINGSGNELDNRLEGNSGDNVLDGGAGNDTLVGGLGNDTYYVDSAGDSIQELNDQGSDTVVANSSYALTGSLENLTLVGSGNFSATGTDAANTIIGNSGNNVIDGGLGADVMSGGAGDDQYWVDVSADSVVESTDAGTDTVYSSASFQLGANIENLLLQGTQSINGTGNSSANVIIGTVGNNWLDGGAGADYLQGGQGDDTYVVDNLSDQVVEQSEEGNDTVRASVSWVLGSHVEDLVLTGTANINGTGNALANNISGNAGANILFGGGGADTINALGGNDRIILTDTNVVAVAGGSGVDTLALDRSGLNNLTQLLGKVSGIERLDFASFDLPGQPAAATANAFKITAAALNTTGLVGPDGGGRLEVVGDGMGVTAGQDVLLLSTAEFFNVLTPGAVAVTLSDGSAGRLLTSKSGGVAIAVDNNVLVLPDSGELSVTWGVNFTTTTQLLPSSFGGLRTWLDATDLDGDGTSEGTNEAGLTETGSGQSVLTWADKSGNGVTFTALNGSSSWRPTWQAAGVTGQAAVRFDGSDQLVSSLTLGNHNYTVYAVGQMTNIGGVTQANRLVSSRETGGWFLGWGDGLQDVASPGRNWLAYQTPTVAATYNSTRVYSAVSFGPTGFAYSDGAALSYFGQVPTGQPGGNLGTLTLGAAGTGGSSASRGEVSEVLVFDRALVEAERLVVDAYLRSKWLTGTPPPVVDPVLGVVGLDPTWYLAPVVFGDTKTNLNDTITASYGSAPARGAGKLDMLLLGGAGNDTLTGGARNDALFGHTGNDTLIGGAGTNYLAGGDGDDTYIVSSLTDTVFEAAGAAGGTDLVQASVSYYLAANVENLTLTGTAALDGAGNDGNNVITGNAGANRLVGAGGNDTLIGGAGNDTLDGGSGADLMSGGTGDDIYFVDNAGDVVTELAGEGTDTVLTYISLASLPANVENAAAVAITPLSLTGNGGNNVLTAGAGQSGISVSHTLTGLGGDDTYRFNSANAISTVVEAANGGTDTVIFANHDVILTYVVPANVENVDLASSARISVTGNTLNNVLTGTSWNAEGYSWLRTTLQGLAGSDTYHINSIYTRVQEIANAVAGTDVDTVTSVFSHRLQPDFENLVLRSAQNADTAGLKGWGNASNNTLTGNEFNNWLDGAGGTDTLIGGAGDDTYVVDDSTDTITETSTGGNDTLRTSMATVDLNATRYANVENLVFTGAVGATGTGTAANNLLAGTSGNDTLSGNDGNDVLYGQGGADTLIGGNGDDQLRAGFRPLPEQPWLQGGVFPGLRLEVYNQTTAHGVASAVGTHTGGLSLTYAAGAAPVAGAPTEGYRVQLVGDLTVTTAGWYTLQSVSTAVAVTIDSQRVLAFNNVGQGTLATIVSLPVWLDAGTVPISVRLSDPTVATSATVLDVRWQRSDSYDAAMSASTFTPIPASAFSYGATAPVDTQGDTLQGGAGNDYLEGGGGTDTLVGGQGSDTYVVQSADDVVTELAGTLEGTADTLMATTGLNLSLQNYDNVENLTLIGSGAQNGTGSAGANVITGTAAANVLSGLGGDDTLRGLGGADTLSGGDGDDVLEAASGSTLSGDAGNDTLRVLDPWSPELLGAGRLALWLDAADLDGDGIREGMAEAGLNGDRVSVWRDKSGNNRHGEVFGEQQSPLLVQGALNGLPALSFDGVDDYIAVAGLPSANSQTQSLFWVQNTTDTVYSMLSNGTVAGGALLSASANDGSTAVSDGGFVSVANPFWKDGTAATWSTRNAAFTALNNTTASVGVVNQAFNFNGGLQFGMRTSATVQVGMTRTDIWSYRGLIPEVLVVSGQLSVAERQYVEGYLAWKWGSQAQLPADHPYRNAAPQLAVTSAGATLNGGDGNDTLIGGANGDTLNGGTGDDTMAGGAGNDTYMVDQAGDVITEAANAGTDTVQSSISHTLGAELENLVLTGDADLSGTGNAAANSLIGNAGANLLLGLGGNDMLDGGAGADQMEGGTGNDTYVVDNAGDLVVEADGAGTDLVQASLNYVLPSFVENLTLTGSATQGTGNGLGNVIVGNGAANQLDGLAGADTLRGMAGNDTYTVDNAGDVVDETAGGLDPGGHGLVRSSVSFTLPSFVESLELTGTANINGTGNAGANTLSGNDGDNQLDGGAGADSLTGGKGNDTYLVDDAGDQVLELGGAGQGSSDLVIASVSYQLTANVEQLQLAAGIAALNATGNGLGNDITGNNGANIIDGGAGADLMRGLDGNDTYYVDDGGDIVVEAQNEGDDTVVSSLSHALGANVENLTLTGSDNHSATGNDANNIIVGNNGSNLIDGKAGADQMSGGAGNDTYLVDDAGDQVFESSGEGTTDQVIAAVSFSLGANVERLTLVGNGALAGNGNAQANLITGNAGDNVLDGAGGNDTLVGGGGVDTLLGDLGDDRLELNAVSNIGQADGGMGQDTLVLSTVGGALDLNALVGKVTNIENLELRDGTASNITLDAAAIQSMTDSRADLVLSLDSGDVLNIQSPYVVQGSGVDATTGQSYTDYLLYTGDTHTATLHVYLPPVNPPGG